MTKPQVPANISAALSEEVRAILTALDAVRRANEALIRATGAQTLAEARRRGKRSGIKAMSRKQTADARLLKATGARHVGAAVAQAKHLEARVEELRRAARREASQRTKRVPDDRDASQSLRTVSGGLPELGKRR
ncbi:MAG: hypothetical protein LC808_36650 [Actinobacteria bacterium]|nr:hypothetical protein [Actinomycetota bacterium]